MLLTREIWIGAAAGTSARLRVFMTNNKTETKNTAKSGKVKSKSGKVKSQTGAGGCIGSYDGAATLRWSARDGTLGRRRTRSGRFRPLRPSWEPGDPGLARSDEIGVPAGRYRLP